MSNINGVRNAKGIYVKTHGLSKHPLYRSWDLMIQRCTKVDHPRYSSYGGRGIKVCERWLDIALYVKDIEALGPKPSPSHSLDRIDNDGNYEPSNIRWASKSEQANNRRIPITNTSGVMGVDYDKRKRLWSVRVTINGKRKRIGRFKTLEEAKKARLAV